MRTLAALLLLTCLSYLTSFGQPVIESFSPTAGPVGTSVTIKGTGFSTTAANNIVYFGAVKATVLDATETTLTVTVPSGATYQPVTVTSNSQTAYATLPFLVTSESGNTEPFTSTSFIPKQDITTGWYPHGLAVADFNLDGKPDLLVSKGSSATVSVLTNTTTAGTLSFGNPLELTAMGNNHEGAATGDLDGDGKLDIVITNSTGINSVSVFRNTSTSSISFASKIDLPVVSGPYDVAIGDVDGDGKADLAVANNGANYISVYRNTSSPGSLSFAAREDIAAGTNPYGIEIADLDADGKPEIIYTTQSTGSSLSVLKNNSAAGTVNFQTPVMVANLSGPMHVAVGDIDGDFKPDLVATSIGANAFIVKRNTSTPGTLSFSGQVYSFATGVYPEGVAISDLDGDGKPDVVVSNRSSHTVSALRNRSTTGTISFEEQVQYAVGEHPIFVATGDLDGDARPDIIAANSSSTYISILKNIIGANIAPVITAFTPSEGISGTTVTITGSNFTNATAVRFGNVDAASYTINSPTSITAVVGRGASGQVSVTTPSGTATLAGFIFTGPIIGSFTPTTGSTGTAVTIHGTNLTSASAVFFGGTPAASFIVNSSTSITAIVGSGASGEVSVTTPEGTASLPGFSYGAPTITNFTPASALAGDTVTITGTNFSTIPIDNLVFFGAVKATVTAATVSEIRAVVPAGATYAPISVTTNRLTAYSSLPFSSRFKNNSPQLAASSFANMGSFGTGTYPASVALADFNNDGKPDLVTTNVVGNNVSILKNISTMGNVDFENKIDLAAGTRPSQAAIGDLDGDGKLDLIAINNNGGLESTMSVFKNTSTGSNITFSPKTDIPTGNGSLDLAIADINGDGKPDVVVTSGNSGFFSIFQNTTVGTTISFAPKQDFRLLQHPDHLVLADLDNDGRTDIITSNFSDDKISVYRNTSAGGLLSLASRLDYPVGRNPWYVSAGDLDSNGKLDIIIKTNNQFSFLKNYSTPGNISLASDLSFAAQVNNIAIADLSGDGKPDLTIGQTANGKIAVYENTTSPSANVSLGSNIDFSTGTYDTYVAVADLDGDGKPDIAAANNTHSTVTIFRNTIGAPIITHLSASTAHHGDTIKITGLNLSEATAIAFGDTPAASFTVVSPEQIDAVVDGGASGEISVTTPAGIARIAGFKFMPVITVEGATSFCNGNFVTLTSTSRANNQWLKDGVAITGATAASYQATSSGTYTVRTTSNGITTTSATGITVSVTTVPTPSITRNGTLLTSSAASGNQWYLNGTLIPGATAQTYQPTEAGNYTVQVTVNECTSNMSVAYSHVVTSVIDLGNNQFIQLYPNPIKDKLFIQWNISNANNMRIDITGISGLPVLSVKNIRAGKAINLTSLSAGIYFVKIYDANEKLLGTQKILKVS